MWYFLWTWYSRIAGWFLSNRNPPSWKLTCPFFSWLGRWFAEVLRLARNRAMPKEAISLRCPRKLSIWSAGFACSCKVLVLYSVYFKTKDIYICIYKEYVYIQVLGINECLCLGCSSICFLFKMVQDFLVPTIPKSGLAAFRCCLHPAIQPLRRGFVVGPHWYPTTSKWCRVLYLATPFSVFFAFFPYFFVSWRYFFRDELSYLFVLIAVALSSLRSTSKPPKMASNPLGFWGTLGLVCCWTLGSIGTAS